MHEQKTISDLFLEVVRGTDAFDGEALERIERSVNEYDRPHLDRLDVMTVLSVSKWGSISMASYYRFLSDPWSAKSWFVSQKDYFFLVLPGVGLDKVEPITAEAAGLTLYTEAKKTGFLKIPEFNVISGYMVSFNELRGSIPEHMREAFEKREWDETTASWKQPNVEKLREWYDREKDTILGYLRLRDKRVQVKDKDSPEHSEWVTVPVTKIGFGFNRFEQVSEGARQSTAFFSVSDNSPEFKPEVSYNWFLQDTSRWLYAGAIAINYSKNEETGEERIDISAHH